MKRDWLFPPPFDEGAAALRKAVLTRAWMDYRYRGIGEDPYRPGGLYNELFPSSLWPTD